MIATHQEFIEGFGREALRAIAAVVAWGHVRSVELGLEQFGDIGLERCGVLRWIMIDADLMRLKSKLPGVDVGLYFNAACGQRHVEISAGKFRLLIAHDRSPEAIVPGSLYGKTLARSNQLLMFEEAAPFTPQWYWAVLFHSKSEAKGQVPDSLEIRFPDGSDGYAMSHLRLYGEFPELQDPAELHRTVNAITGTTVVEEVVVNRAVPTLRPAQQTGT